MNGLLRVRSKLLYFLNISLVVLLATGCQGLRTFNENVFSGETIAIPAGWRPEFSRDNINVWVKENGVGTPWVMTAGPDDPSIRAVVNFYPDPLSSLVVSERLNSDQTAGAVGFGNNILASSSAGTDGYRDWYQTIVFYDLPDPLALGETDVWVENASNFDDYATMKVNIIGTGGVPHDFDAALVAGPLARNHLAALERVDHYIIDFSGSAIPHALQVDFTHDPDAAHGGTGKAIAIEAMSSMKNLSYHEDATTGTNLRVIIMPTNGTTFTSFKDLRFYVAGGLSNLVVASVQAFDSLGGDVTGVTHSVTHRTIAIDDTP